MKHSPIQHIVDALFDSLCVSEKQQWKEISLQTGMWHVLI